MALGPGKYDDECTGVRERTGAAGVILMVIGGAAGPGFSCQGDLATTMALPSLLRETADQIEKDLRANTFPGL